MVQLREKTPSKRKHSTEHSFSPSKRDGLCEVYSEHSFYTQDPLQPAAGGGRWVAAGAAGYEGHLRHDLRLGQRAWLH